MYTRRSITRVGARWAAPLAVRGGQFARTLSNLPQQSDRWPGEVVAEGPQTRVTQRRSVKHPRARRVRDGAARTLGGARGARARGSRRRARRRRRAGAGAGVQRRASTVLRLPAAEARPAVEQLELPAPGRVPGSVRRVLPRRLRRLRPVRRAAAAAAAASPAAGGSGGLAAARGRGTDVLQQWRGQVGLHARAGQWIHVRRRGLLHQTLPGLREGHLPRLPLRLHERVRHSGLQQRRALRLRPPAHRGRLQRCAGQPSWTRRTEPRLDRQPARRLRRGRTRVGGRSARHRARRVSQSLGRPVPRGWKQRDDHDYDVPPPQAPEPAGAEHRRSCPFLQCVDRELLAQR